MKLLVLPFMFLLLSGIHHSSQYIQASTITLIDRDLTSGSVYHLNPNITSTSSSAINCQIDRNYTSMSPYQLNLNLTLTSLVGNASLYDYFAISIGRSPDVVYGIVQCSGYTPSDACQACASNMVTEIIQTCPNQKQGTAYIDKCSLRYSDWNFFSTMDSDPRFFKWNTDNATDIVLFRSNLEELLNFLLPSAAANLSRISSGMTTYTKGQNIYAMVQCSKGISANDCLTCLERITMSYMLFLNTMEQGETGLLVAHSCNLRVDTYQFFTVAPTSQPGSSEPPPPSPVPSDSVLDKRNHSTSDGSSLVPADSLPEGTGKNSKIMIMLVMAAAFVLILITSICSSLLWRNQMRNRVVGDSNRSLESLLMEFDKLREATNKFSDGNKLGQGGFGPVYKADQKRRLKLSWEMRYNIIVGIARGLLYLHEEHPLKIIHRDMKASNILLDESMNPKISDFGLARLFPGTQNHCFTNKIIGTYGYMAPEYAIRGRYSTKSDVYSFGILVLEIITGSKNSSFEHSRNLQSYAWKHWIDGTALKILDPILGEEFKKDEVLKCIMLEYSNIE
ncbi:Cysteine-rich receptor-like protein kinase 6 [Linum perenne]